MADGTVKTSSVDGQTDKFAALNQDLAKMFSGEPVPVSTIDFRRKDAMQFQPQTKVNTGYIVVTTLFNERNQVLLVQEAKDNCKGSWYLPAGRLEPNESLVEGAKREVKEEAGLTCDIVSLLSFQFGGARWMRFAFLGNITGGKLKSLAEQDEESLQAEFYDLSTVFNWKVNLRSGDIISVIHLALEYKDSMASVPLHPALHPVTAAHSLLLHRFILVVDRGSNDGLVMLVARSGKPHLVTCAIAPKDPTILITVHAIIRIAITGETFFPTVHGMVGVEHSGSSDGKDGMCLTTLISLAVPKGKGLPAMRDKDYMWVPITDETCIDFIRKGLDGHMCKIIEKQL